MSDQQRHDAPAEVFRKLASSLPQAEEHEHWERPSFRVRGRIFATLWPDEARGVVKVSRGEMMALAEADPAIFTARPWGASSWLSVALPKVDPDQLGELIVEAWRGVAPKRVVTDFDREQGSHGAAPR